MLSMHMEQMNLLGGEWIRKLEVDLGRLFVGSIALATASLNEILGRYSTLFRPGLGRSMRSLIHFHVREGVQPKFFNPRPIPFATQQVVEADLQ